MTTDFSGELVRIVEETERYFLAKEDQKQGYVVEEHPHIVVEHATEHPQQEIDNKDQIESQQPHRYRKIETVQKTTSTSEDNPPMLRKTTSKGNITIKKFPILKHPKQGGKPEAKKKVKKVNPINDKTQRKITDLFKPNMNENSCVENMVPNNDMKRAQSSKDAQSSESSASSAVASLIHERTEMESSRSFQEFQTCPDLGENSNLISLFNDSLV